MNKCIRRTVEQYHSNLSGCFYSSLAVGLYQAAAAPEIRLAFSQIFSILLSNGAVLPQCFPLIDKPSVAQLTKKMALRHTLQGPSGPFSFQSGPD